MGTKTKLSQWDALMLESLKAHGWPSDELLAKIHAGDLPKDESKFQFDYTGLTAFAREHAETLAQAVQEGYQIKYNTIRGIHSWILVALGQEAELVLEPGQEAVIASLTEEDAALLASVLSFGWAISPAQDSGAASDANGRSLYRVEPAERRGSSQA
ncbi:hypothetical protein D3P08_02060 [Paenibacillus nanensis]|uniref:Uncharacterized protein n=1 Tax=Paenibacillus nanensis TaxID=393251 RepID=A0A3A1VPA6_9BACL|nr:hypothetical protein [Paenibacillus nanensis]RIX60373.1 hypothetical protein D3P08_02060 [Paenibacillus nanensis]